MPRTTDTIGYVKLFVYMDNKRLRKDGGVGGGRMGKPVPHIWFHTKKRRYVTVIVNGMAVRLNAYVCVRPDPPAMRRNPRITNSKIHGKHCETETCRLNICFFFFGKFMHTVVHKHAQTHMSRCTAGTHHIAHILNKFFCVCSIRIGYNFMACTSHRHVQKSTLNSEMEQPSWRNRPLLGGPKSIPLRISRLVQAECGTPGR